MPISTGEPELSRPVRPRRRFGRILAAVVLLAGLGYWISPYVAVARFASAAHAGRTEALLARIDVDDLRASFARQIVRAFVARNPQARGLDPMSRQMVASVIGGYVTAIVSDHLTLDAIAGLLTRQRISTGAGDILGTGSAFPRLESWRDVWAAFGAAGFTGPTRFSLESDMAAAHGERFRLHFGLKEWSWLLRSVELPESVLNRLADELKMRIDRQN